MSTVAFCQVETAEIKEHLEKKGVNVNPSHTSYPPPHVNCVLAYLLTDACNHTVTKLFLCSLTSAFPFDTQNTGDVSIRWYEPVCCKPLVSLCMHRPIHVVSYMTSACRCYTDRIPSAPHGT